MAPLRSLLASRAVIAGLVALGCLGLLISTLEPDTRNLSWKYNNNNNNNAVDNNQNNNNNSNNLQGTTNVWQDANKPADDLGKPLSHYPGRRPLTVQAMIEKAEGYYKRILNQRHAMLQHYGFGTSTFDPWNVGMYYWWYFPASFVCPHDIQRVGPLHDGGKWICGMSFYEEQPRAKCVIYSFGINYEVKWELDMLERTDCEIYAYDASVPNMGEATRPGRTHFFPYFVGRTDHTDASGHQVRSLKSLMKENGHDWIDILKVDVEGAEYETFDAIMDDFDVLPFSQLQMELHVRYNMIQFPDFLKWWERLESKGVYPWWTELNLNPTFSGEKDWASEYCFLNTRGGAKNLLIQNYV